MLSCFSIGFKRHNLQLFWNRESGFCYCYHKHCQIKKILRDRVLELSSIFSVGKLCYGLPLNINQLQDNQSHSLSTPSTSTEGNSTGTSCTWITLIYICSLMVCSSISVRRRYLSKWFCQSKSSVTWQKKLVYTVTLDEEKWKNNEELKSNWKYNSNALSPKSHSHIRFQTHHLLQF